MSARPLTIAYVTQAPFIGGAERALLRLATTLEPTRYRPLVIAGHDGAFVAALRAAGVDHCHIPLPHPDRAKPAPFLHAVLRLVIQFRRRRVALIHINDAPAHSAAAMAARIVHRPRICHLRFSYPAEGLRWFLKYGFERAVFPSLSLQQHAQTCCPELFVVQRCAVVHDGVDASPPPAASRLTELRRECGLDADEPVVGFVGRIVESKGVADFLNMAALLRDRIRCRFLLVGDDQRAGGSNYRDEMEALARRSGIADACRFLGFRDDVWDLLHLCAVVVVPSHVEPFGNVTLEAAAAGRAVIATRVGGIPEIVHDGDTGVLVDPHDPPALAEAALALLRDPTRRELLGRAAHTDVTSRFSEQQHATRMMSLYDELYASGH
jgi:glycosyltransferase involved in cell wall biosynthesis